MKRVGEVTRTAQGLLVVRSVDDSYPRLGTTVIDENLDEIGTVVTVFGPVERPYLAVSPDGEPRASFVGSALYARD